MSSDFVRTRNTFSPVPASRGPSLEDTPRKPRLLDLFCGAGSAGRGYQSAGFQVIGVDLSERGYVGDSFWHGDALEYVHALIETGWAHDSLPIHAIHASPPCIRWTDLPLTKEQRERHPDLITPLRPLLDATGLPYVIENVRRAPLSHERRHLICGVAVGLRVVRHRYFETNWPLMTAGCAHRRGATLDGELVNFRPRGPLAPGRRMPARRSEDDFRRAAGTDFLTGQAARDAIPPAYTELIGHQLMQHLRAKEAA